MPLQCNKDDTISALAANLQKNATLFDIHPDDIKLNTLEIYQNLPNNKKKKVEFFERVTTLSDHGYLVEFDHHPLEMQEIRVKYVNSINPIKIRCGVDDFVCDLSDKILENLNDFPLSSDDRERIRAEGSEIQLFFPSSDGGLEPLDPMHQVSRLPKKYVMFDVRTQEMKDKGNAIKLYVRHQNSRCAEVIVCWENDTVLDVIKDIKSDITRFGLSMDDVKELDDQDKVMVLVKPGQKTGDVAVAMEPYDSVSSLKDQVVVFRMEDKEVKQVTIDEIEKFCVGQTIAFFGASGHGKSSTINTIGEVIPGVETPLADIWKGTAAGTIVISSLPVEVGIHTFNLLDVPGNGLPQYESPSDEKKARDVIRWILQGSFPKDTKPDFWTSKNILGAWLTYMKSESSGRVDIVVIVHNASAYSPDKLNNLVVAEARQQRGNGIPVMAVITHVDELKDDAELKEKVTELSDITGIDESFIFPISNLSGKGSYLRGSERDNYVLTMLKQMLARSKRYKSQT
ncbi:uncharacterized protein [Ptychodera flava]|uniref:uncharacterized protein n=1 Tax=Ptychodera flava TaxID=63121 RepID=UPI003969FEAD